MFRPRRLLWLVIIGGIGYAAWRWRQSRVAAQPAPAMAPPPPPVRTASAPPAAAGSPADAPPSGPRRITTRVHRGAPPSMPLAPAPTAPAPPANAAEEPPAAPSEPPAVVEQTLAPISAEEALGEPAEHEPQAAHEQTLAPVAAEEISDVEAAPASLVNVNTAELQALIDLPGIGPALAARIITYREQNGDFATVEQLVDVQGIGPNNMNEFRHLITV